MAALGNLVRSGALKVTMALSVAGAGGLMVHEGLNQTGYYDTVGVPTACYGHTRTAVVGKFYPMEVCQRLFGEDIAKFEAAVNKAVLVPLTQSQFDALVSFAYNVGIGSFNSSTLLKKLNAGDYEGAANQFDVWRFATRKGVKLDCKIRVNQCYGVYARRMDEKALFKSGAY